LKQQRTNEKSAATRERNRLIAANAAGANRAVNNADIIFDAAPLLPANLVVVAAPLLPANLAAPPLPVNAAGATDVAVNTVPSFPQTFLAASPLPAAIINNVEAAGNNTSSSLRRELETTSTRSSSLDGEDLFNQAKSKKKNKNNKNNKKRIRTQEVDQEQIACANEDPGYCPFNLQQLELVQDLTKYEKLNINMDTEVPLGSLVSIQVSGSLTIVVILASKILTIAGLFLVGQSRNCCDRS
jgi:hypothetical protein